MRWPEVFGTGEPIELSAAGIEIAFRHLRMYPAERRLSGAPGGDTGLGGDAFLLSGWRTPAGIPAVAAGVEYRVGHHLRAWAGIARRRYSGYRNKAHRGAGRRGRRIVNFAGVRPDHPDQAFCFPEYRLPKLRGRAVQACRVVECRSSLPAGTTVRETPRGSRLVTGDGKIVELVWA